MLHRRRVRRYQEFLKTLRRPEPQLCLCPFHLHPRPWVPPPCRTSRPHGEPSLLLSRRFHSNPELLAHSSHTGAMERKSLSQKDKAQHSRYIERLHHEEDLIKEAQRRVHNGDPLPKDMYNTVMKWSKMSPKLEEETTGAGQRREKKQQTSHIGRKKGTSEREFEKEEEKLRQELKNVRDLNQHNIYLLEENKRLMKKIQKLQQRAKRQGEARKGSRESMEAPRQDDVILSLRKKYEDLLQYVLKVEAENQKLNSLAGASGEGRGTDIKATRRTLTELQEETQALRQQLMEKDENLMKYEEQLKAMKDSTIILQDALKKQRLGGSWSSETAMLEEEWMRRFNETREMYEEAIQGYKDQLEQTQRKVVMEEQDHAQQIEELRKQLHEAQTQLQAEEKNRLEEAKVVEEKDHTKAGEGKQVDELKGGQNEVRTKGSPGHQVTKSDGSNSPKNLPSTAHIVSPKHSKEDTQTTQPQATSHCTEGEGKPESTAVTKTDEMYSEALTLIVRRLESLQIGRGEVEGMMGTIKDTINTCLQEWRDSFQQTRAQQDQHKNQLQHENEELQRKLRTRNKKIETLQKQNEDQQRQNEKLLHQCSLLESQMASTRTTEQLGILSGLPQKVQEAEHQLADTKELLHKAQVENQGLQSHLKHLEEKLGKKESKLKTEREQSLSREKEVAGARESVSSLQHQLEEMRREMNQLCEQLSTKDVILEHTSAQLEERIRECASLSALADRYKLQQNQDSDRIQTQLNERETASHKQLLEAQTQASRFQAQVSALRTEKEHTEKSLRCTVRKLEEQVDQLQLRNSTLQRQLTTFTSTYHNLFSSVDLPSVTTPAIDTTVFKGI
ncbi:trichohyalin-like isoform X2 [Portunus trituberculatus]|nr:trichohyalin-like isoform X2 [Portunus trituberculatus]XP_045120767.1 trichohyalin-like isoform X2 [Portunus trituberculatus]XP_045120768.1 trichohyalin-like isoform X2 [Portunus trituberculatus]